MCPDERPSKSRHRWQGVYRADSVGEARGGDPVVSRKTSEMKERGMHMTKERWGSLFFLFPGIYGLIFSRDIPMGEWNNPGPGMFPFGLSVLLVISGVLWFIRGKRTAEEQEKIGWRGIAKTQVTPFKIVVLTAAFILVLDQLGYLLGSFLYLLLIFFWVSRFSIWISTALALGVGICSWYLFGRILLVQLPVGVLPF
jgi:putative tricarboxylic transport membrane protein